MPEIGTFQLGEYNVGESAVVSIGSTTTAAATPTAPTANSITTSQALKTILDAQGIVTDPDTSASGEGNVVSFSGTPLQSGPVASVVTGSITSASATTIGATATAVSTSEGISAVLATTTVLAASGDTAAAGGEVLRLELSPEVATASTTVEAGGIPQTATGTGVVVNPFTTIEGFVPEPTLAVGNGIEVDPFTQTTSQAEVVDAALNPFSVDPDTAATASVAATSLESFVKGATAISTTEGGEPTLATGGPLDAIRYRGDWAVYPGPKIVRDVSEEVRTYREMTLTWQVGKESLVDTLRPEIEDTGKVRTVDRIDGGFDVVSLGEDNLIRLKAPTDHTDVRPIEDWYVQEFEESPLGTEAERWEVELTVTPEKEKAFDNEYGTLDSPPSETRGSSEWLFEFERGDIATRRVTTDVAKTPNGSIDSAELQLVVSPEEVRVIEESASALAANDPRRVPDGTDLINDESSDQRNTVSVTPPHSARDTLGVGEYIVSEWETTWTRNRFHEVTLILKQS